MAEVDDIILEKEVRIYVVDTNDILFPHGTLYPDGDLYPQQMRRIDTDNLGNGHIVLGSMDLNEILCQDDIHFGQLCATKFEVTLYDFNEDLTDKILYVCQIDGSDVYPVFFGIVDSCTTDQLNLDRVIVAYDLAYKLSKLDVSAFWNSFWETNTNGTSLKYFRNQFLTYLKDTALDGYGGLETSIHQTLPNDDVIFDNPCKLTSISASMLLEMICELSRVIPHFDRLGNLRFIQLSKDTSKQIVDNIEIQNCTFENYTIANIDAVQINNMDGEVLYSVGNTDGINVYIIEDNLLVLQMSDEYRQQIANRLLSNAYLYSYRPATIKLIVGSFDYELGDCVTIDNEQEKYYVLETHFSGSQFVECELISQGDNSKSQVGRDLEYKNTDIELEMTAGDAADVAEDAKQDAGDIQDAIAQVGVEVKQGDDYIMQTVREVTTDKWWDTSQIEDVNHPIVESGFGAPTVTEVLTTVWNTQGYTISRYTEGKPNWNDYSKEAPTYQGEDVVDAQGRIISRAELVFNSDVGTFTMDDTTGDIYYYYCKVFTDYRKVEVPNGNGRYKMIPYLRYVYKLDKIANGRVLYVRKDYESEPYVEIDDENPSQTPEMVGKRYLDMGTGEDTYTGAGEIYQLDGRYIHLYDTDHDSYSYWTWLLEWQKVYTTRQGQTVPLKATSVKADLYSKIEQRPTSISLTTEADVDGNHKKAGITISILDENDNLLDSDTGVITMTGLVEFSDLSTNGSTEIHGGNIKTNTLSVNSLRTTQDQTIFGPAFAFIELSSNVGFKFNDYYHQNEWVGIQPNTLNIRNIKPPIDANGDYTGVMNIGSNEIPVTIEGNTIDIYGDDYVTIGSFDRHVEILAGNNGNYGRIKLKGQNDALQINGGEGDIELTPGHWTWIDDENEENTQEVYCDIIMGNDSHREDTAVKIYGKIYNKMNAVTTSGSNVWCDPSSNGEGRMGRTTGSSKRWKHDIKDVTSKELAPQKLYDLPVRQFKFNKDYIPETDKRYDIPVIGFIAEEMDKIYPIACEYDEENQPCDWSDRYVLPAMLKLIQEQNERITVLEEEIKKLKEE